MVDFSFAASPLMKADVFCYVVVPRSRSILFKLATMTHWIWNPSKPRSHKPRQAVLLPISGRT